VVSRIVLWWSGFTALTGIAWNYPSLLVTTFLFGAGEAEAGPNMMVSLPRWFPLTERVRAMSIMLMAAEVGTALTPLFDTNWKEGQWRYASDNSGLVSYVPRGGFRGRTSW
jgi:ACS family glucarate transporter-like MFS transporter